MFGIWPHYLLWLCILMLLSFWQTSYKGLCHYWLCEPDTGRSNHREQTEWIIMLHCTSYSSSKSYGLNFEDKFLGWFVFFNEWINLKVFDRNVRNKSHFAMNKDTVLGLCLWLCHNKNCLECLNVHLRLKIPDKKLKAVRQSIVCHNKRSCA